MKTLYKYLIFILILFISLEIILRISKLYLPFEESIGGEYFYKFQRGNDSWFHTWSPNALVDYKQSEFHYQNYYNELGHREILFSDFQKIDTAEKVIVLGDSFTEGDGAPFDSTWVTFFQKKMNEIGSTKIITYNAGVCGSDVFFNYMMLKEKLLVSKPKAVLECVNHSDLMDVYYMGGFERFQADGTTKSSKEKNWEPLFKYSHFFRMLVCTFSDYNVNLVKKDTFEKEEEKSLKLIATQINTTYNLCKKNNIEYYLILIPTPNSLKKLKKDPTLELPNQLDPSIQILNVNNCMQTIVDKNENTVLSWPINGHYNGFGYKVLGECIFTSFEKLNEK